MAALSSTTLETTRRLPLSLARFGSGNQYYERRIGRLVGLLPYSYGLKDELPRRHLFTRKASLNECVMSQVPRSDLFWEGCEWNVGRYQLGEVIGRGTYGTVHACLDLDTGKDLAVKVVPKHHTGENTGVEKSLCAVENEVRVLSCLKNCPSLVRLVDFFQDSGSVYVVLERVRGHSLQSRLKEHGTLSEAETASDLFDILSTLTHFHQHGIIHGDIKPANFVYCRKPCEPDVLGGGSLPFSPWPARNMLKTVDCGCSRFAAEIEGGEMGAGTPIFTAPEVFRRSPSCKSDVWSAGMLLCLLLTGRLPFWDTLRGLGAGEVLHGILEADLQLESAALDGVSAEAKDLVGRMLTRDVRERATAEDALRHPWIQRWYWDAREEYPSLRPGAAELPSAAADRQLEAEPEIVLPLG